jgi:hypothetical protein
VKLVRPKTMSCLFTSHLLHPPCVVSVGHRSAPAPLPPRTKLCRQEARQGKARQGGRRTRCLIQDAVPRAMSARCAEQSCSCAATQSRTPGVVVWVWCLHRPAQNKPAKATAIPPLVAFNWLCLVHQIWSVKFTVVTL